MQNKIPHFPKTYPAQALGHVSGLQMPLFAPPLFWRATSRTTSPHGRRSCPDKTWRRYCGINTTCYLPSHFV